MISYLKANKKRLIVYGVCALLLILVAWGAKGTAHQITVPLSNQTPIAGASASLSNKK